VTTHAADPMPLSDNPEEAARQKVSARRARMLDGEWQQDANEEHASFFHEDVRALLPDADISLCVFLSLHTQQSTAYDEDPTVRIDPEYADGAEVLQDETLLSKIVTDSCWPVMTQALPRINGMHELGIYVTWTEEGGIHYEMTDPSALEGTATAAKPDQFADVIRTRRRRHPKTGVLEWTREIWDPTSSPPVYRIEARRPKVDADSVMTMSMVPGTTAATQMVWTDVTAEYAPDAVNAYPRVDREGMALMPIILYHDRINSKLWRPKVGEEVVRGTLTVSSLNTMWLMGMRDNAYPQRYALNARAQGISQGKPKDGSQVSYIPIHPGVILQFASTTGVAVQFGEWKAGMDPKAYRDAIEGYVRELAIHAGISPSDLKVTGGQSGYAIALSKEGKRKAEKRVIPSLRRADRLRLATAAKLVNAAHEANLLPEDPRAYVLTYNGVQESSEERKADTDEASKQREQGVLGPVQHYQKLHPEKDDVAALADLIANAKQEAMLARIRAGNEAPAGAPAAAPDTTPDPDDNGEATATE